MISYTSLRRTPRAFHRLSGITVEEFDRLYEDVEAVWVVAEQARLGGRERQRAIGGGRAYTLTLQTQLLMTLVWLRLYLTTATLGYLFGVSQATASRTTRRLLGVLREVSGDAFGWPDPPRKGEGRTVEALAQAEPDLFAILDATE